MDAYIPPASDAAFTQKKYIDDTIADLEMLSTIVVKKEYTFTNTAGTHTLTIEKNAAGLMTYWLQLAGALSSGSEFTLFTIPDVEWRPPKGLVLCGGVDRSDTDIYITIGTDGRLLCKTVAGYIRPHTGYSVSCQTTKPDAAHVLSIDGIWKNVEDSAWNNNFTNGTYTVESKTGISGLQMITFDYNGSGSLTVDQCSIGSGQTMTLVVDGSAIVTVTNNSGNPGTRAKVLAVPVGSGAYIIDKPFMQKVKPNHWTSNTQYYYKLGTLTLPSTAPTGNYAVVVDGIMSTRSSDSSTDYLLTAAIAYVKYHTNGNRAANGGDQGNNSLYIYTVTTGNNVEIWVRTNNGYSAGFMWRGHVKFLSENFMVDTFFAEDRAKFVMTPDILSTETSTQPSGSR